MLYTAAVKQRERHLVDAAVPRARQHALDEPLAVSDTPRLQPLDLGPGRIVVGHPALWTELTGLCHPEQAAG